MLTTKPYLRTRRPSPTTAEFIVSTLPPLTRPLRVLLGVVYLVRLLAGLCVLQLLYSAWTLSPFAAPYLPPSPAPPAPTRISLSSLLDYSTTFLSLGTLHRALHTIQTATSAGRLAARAAAALGPWWLVMGACGGLLYVCVMRLHAEERLLVLRGLGIQTSTGAATVLGRPTTRFIPTEKIRDVLVAEAFRGFAVRHYLVVVVDGEEDVVVVFPRLLPRPRILEKVWRGVRGCLYEYDCAGVGAGAGAGRRAAAHPALDDRLDEKDEGDADRNG